MSSARLVCEIKSLCRVARFLKDKSIRSLFSGSFQDGTLQECFALCDQALDLVFGDSGGHCYSDFETSWYDARSGDETGTQ